jgi:hypothetical protein
MNPLIQLKQTTAVFVVAFGLSSAVQAVSPPPDGGYPNFTTAEGQNALFSLSTGQGNTAIGHDVLFSDTTGSWNTGVGAVALGFNDGDFNTAVGAAALLLNTTGSNNTAVGTAALVNNNTSGNTGVGAFALNRNTFAVGNTAIGDSALLSNDNTGAGLANSNTAVGSSSLRSNTDGDSNSAVGYYTLYSNVSGLDNTAMGQFALFTNSAGSFNTAVGMLALYQNTGFSNTAIGWHAGNNIDGNGNIDIGASTVGLPGESGVTRIGDPQASGYTACYINGIYNKMIGGAGVPHAVWIDADGNLGLQPSSRRFKQDIKPIEKASEAILALKPVTFHYKTDKLNMPQFGLIAEDVAAVDPNLVIRNDKGEVYTVRYDAVSAMLLNEFLKEYRKNQLQESKIGQQEAQIAQLQKQIEALTAGLQEVSAQLEVNKSAPQVARNN